MPIHTEAAGTTHRASMFAGTTPAHADTTTHSVRVTIIVEVAVLRRVITIAIAIATTLGASVLNIYATHVPVVVILVLIFVIIIVAVSHRQSFQRRSHLRPPFLNPRPRHNIRVVQVPGCRRGE